MFDKCYIRGHKWRLFGCRSICQVEGTQFWQFLPVCLGSSYHHPSLHPIKLNWNTNVQVISLSSLEEQVEGTQFWQFLPVCLAASCHHHCNLSTDHLVIIPLLNAGCSGHVDVEKKMFEDKYRRGCHWGTSWIGKESVIWLFTAHIV